MEEKKERKAYINEHLANERTFLAWIRTSIGIIGLGFVVVKFSIFVRQITFALEGIPKQAQTSGLSPIIGILLVGLGTVTTILSYIRYYKNKEQLDAGQFYQSSILIKIVTAMIFGGSLFMIIYLVQSI